MVKQEENNICLCEVPYSKFRTGLNFNEVRQMLWKESQRKREQNEHMFITRKTVLGRWHEIKEKMWKELQSQLDGIECDCQQ